MAADISKKAGQADNKKTRDFKDQEKCLSNCRGKAKLVRDEEERIYVAKPVSEWTDHRVASILSYLRAPEFPRCLGWCGPAADLPLKDGFCDRLPEIIVSPKPQTVSYLMEYVEGKSLAEIRNENPAAELVMQWILHLEKSLQDFSSLLQKPVLHLDIKPGNIIISPDNTPTLIDFGCALILDDIAEQWVEVKRATAAYAAPEVQACKPHVNSDLFSLARTAISVLSGKPYLALTEAEISDALSQQSEKDKSMLLRWQNSNPEIRSQAHAPVEVLKPIPDYEMTVAAAAAKNNDVKNNVEGDAESVDGIVGSFQSGNYILQQSDKSILQQSDKYILQHQSKSVCRQNNKQYLQLPTIPLVGLDQSQPVSIHVEYKLTVSPLAEDELELSSKHTDE